MSHALIEHKVFPCGRRSRSEYAILRTSIVLLFEDLSFVLLCETFEEAEDRNHTYLCVASVSCFMITVLTHLCFSLCSS